MKTKEIEEIRRVFKLRSQMTEEEQIKYDGDLGRVFNFEVAFFFIIMNILCYISGQYLTDDSLLIIPVGIVILVASIGLSTIVVNLLGMRKFINKIKSKYE
jgi:hypothetical protein